MTARTRLAIAVEGQEGLRWTQWRQLCHLVDTLGFDSLWRSDHMQSVLGMPQRDCLEAWTSLALAAEWTKTIEFGPLVTPMTFRPPKVLARMAESVDVLSHGRLVLGLGAGWHESEHEAFGLPFRSTAQRLEDLERGIDDIRSIHRAFKPGPIRSPIPILLGGSGKQRSVTIAARHAEEYNASEMTPAQYAACCQRLDEACRQAGRAPESLRRSVNLSVLIADSEASLLRGAGELGTVLPEFAGQDPRAVLDTLRSRTPGPWLVGTPRQIADQLAPFAAIGLDRAILTIWALDDLEATLRLLGGEVADSLARG